MQIYILPTPTVLRPASQPFKFPVHNEDFGVEQDFLLWIKGQAEFVTDDPAKADFHYLPVFWTRYHLNHDFGKFGQEELSKAARDAIIDDAKTFTICQYADGPQVDLGKTILFLASRQTSEGIDIPLLCSPHRIPLWKPRKQHLASFVGNLGTHPMRGEMANSLENRSTFFLFDGNKGERFFVQKTLSSQVCLAPRGYGGSSFRAFEAMQLGVLPLIIGDIDTRPFKSYLDWQSCSLFTNNPAEIPSLLAAHDESVLRRMGRASRRLFLSSLAMGRWCRFVPEELKART